MKHYAYGYTDWDPLVEPDPVTIIPVDDVAHYESVVESNRSMWWTFHSEPTRWERLVARIPDTPTPRSRLIGAGVATFLLLLVMAVVGAIEGHAATDTPRRVILASEWVAWQSMGEEAQAAYCDMYRGYAEYVWLDGMSEGAYWNESPRKLEWVAQRVLARGCGEWKR